MKTDLSSSSTFNAFASLISALSSALSSERDLCADCFDPAFQSWLKEADAAWGQVRERAEAVLGFRSIEPDDHMLQRVAWLIRMMLDVEKASQLHEARYLVARYVRISRTLPMSPDFVGLLHDAQALVDETLAQFTMPASDPVHPG